MMHMWLLALDGDLRSWSRQINSPYFPVTCWSGLTFEAVVVRESSWVSVREMGMTQSWKKTVAHGWHMGHTLGDIRKVANGSKTQQGQMFPSNQVANTGSVLEIAYKNTKKTRWEKSHCCLREVLKWLLIRVAVISKLCTLLLSPNYFPDCQTFLVLAEKSRE